MIYGNFIPSTSLASRQEDSPLFNIGILEIGQQTSVEAGASFNSLLEVTPLKISLDLGAFQIAIGWEGNQVEIGFSTPSTDYSVEGSDMTVSHQQSATVAITYDWWNTTIRGEYNTIDLSVSGSDDQPGFEGNLSQGIYFEEKPVQVTVYFALAKVVVAAGILFPESLIALSTQLDKLIPNPMAP